MKYKCWYVPYIFNSNRYYSYGIVEFNNCEYPPVYEDILAISFNPPIYIQIIKVEEIE